MNTTDPKSAPRGCTTLVGECEMNLNLTTEIKFTRVMKMEKLDDHVVRNE